MTQPKFRVLLADPPSRSGQLGKRGAERHYELMSFEEIASMPIADLMLDDSWCFLWVTNQTLFEEGPAILSRWGFTLVKQPITWVKLHTGLGSPLRNSTEHILVGRRGHPQHSFRAQPTHLIAPRQGHSVKPDEQFALIERLVGSNGPFLELFARRRPKNPAWLAWGREVPGGSDIVIPGYPVPSKGEEAHR